jgi:hypothetical protein
MDQPLATGDRVAWTESDRGIIVAETTAHTPPRHCFTVAVWRAGAFSGHVTRIPAAMLYRTVRLHSTLLPGTSERSGQR